MNGSNPANGQKFSRILTVTALIVALLGSAGGWVWNAATLASDVQENRQRLNKLEQIIRQDHDRMVRIERGVQAIHDRMDRNMTE